MFYRVLSRERKFRISPIFHHTRCPYLNNYQIKSIYIESSCIMKLMIQQRLLYRPKKDHWHRQCCCVIIPLFSLVALALQQMEIISGFTNQVRRIRSCQWYEASFWSTTNHQTTFIKFQRPRPQLLHSHQIHHSDSTTNLTQLSVPRQSIDSTPNATVAVSSNRMYDLGVGKHQPLSINTDNDNTTTNIPLKIVSSNAEAQFSTTFFDIDKEPSSTANNTTIVNARLIGMNWMVPESVVKPSYMNANDVSNSVTSTTDQSLQYQQPNTKTEQKSRRMVAYVGFQQNDHNVTFYFLLTFHYFVPVD